jgi:hypothetical protein
MMEVLGQFRNSKRISPVDHHSDLPSGAAQPYWYGHDLGFVIDHAALFRMRFMVGRHLLLDIWVSREKLLKII